MAERSGLNRLDSGALLLTTTLMASNNTSTEVSIASIAAHFFLHGINHLELGITNFRVSIASIAAHFFLLCLFLPLCFQLSSGSF